MSDFVIKTKNGKVVLTARQTHFFAAAISRDIRPYIDTHKGAFEKWKVEVKEDVKM